MSNVIEASRPQVDFTVLIPVFNSEKSLPLVLTGVRQVFAENKRSYEFVLVDDGSTDNSWGVIQQEYRHGDICGIQLIRNQGHSIALKRAFDFCHGEWIITMDDDLQHPPAELPKLIAATENADDVDIIMGSYDSSRSHIHKTLGAKIYQAVLRKAFSLPKGLRITSYRVIHRRIVDEVKNRHLASPHAGFMLLSATNKVMNVPVEYHSRRFGESGMGLKKSLTTLLDGIALNSALPLRIIGFSGLLLAGTAILLALYYTLLSFTNNITVSGFATMVVLITFFSGMILAAISITGLYIMRLFQQSTFSPMYSLRSHLPRNENSVEV